MNASDFEVVTIESLREPFGGAAPSTSPIPYPTKTHRTLLGVTCLTVAIFTPVPQWVSTHIALGIKLALWLFGLLCIFL